MTRLQEFWQEAGVPALYERLLEAEYDSSFTQEERDQLAQLRLTILDIWLVVAGIRDEPDGV